MKKRYFGKVKPSLQVGRVVEGQIYWKGMELSTGDRVRITTVHNTGAFCKDFDVIEVDVDIITPASYA